MKIRSVPPVDRLDRDGEALLLYEGRVVRLGPIGVAITTLAADEVDLADVASALEQRFGVPDGQTVWEATRDAVDDLIAFGALDALTVANTPDPEETHDSP